MFNTNGIINIVERALFENLNENFLLYSFIKIIVAMIISGKYISAVNPIVCFDAIECDSTKLNKLNVRIGHMIHINTLIPSINPTVL